MRLPKCWAQPSKITVDCKRKKSSSSAHLGSLFPKNKLTQWVLASHLESLKLYTGAFSLSVGLSKALYGFSSIFELLRASVQFTSWCNRISPKGSCAHLYNQCLLVHPFTWRSNWQVRAHPCHKAPMMQSQAHSSNKAMGQVSNGAGQLMAKVSFTGIRTIQPVVLVPYFQFLSTENVK